MPPQVAFCPSSARKIFSHKRPVLLAAMLSFLLMGNASVAHSTPSEDSAASWGVLGLGVGTSLGLTCMAVACRDPKIKVASMVVLPLGTAVLFGLAGHKGKWKSTIPTTIQGAANTGLTLFLLGDLIGDDSDKANTIALAMGATGALLGAYVGATQVKGSSEIAPWMTLEYLGSVGALAGITAVGINWLTKNPWSADTRGKVISWSGFGGLALGTAIGYAIALSGDEQKPSVKVAALSNMQFSPFGLSGSF